MDQGGLAYHFNSLYGIFVESYKMSLFDCLDPFKKKEAKIQRDSE